MIHVPTPSMQDRTFQHTVVLLLHTPHPLLLLPVHRLINYHHPIIHWQFVLTLPHHLRLLLGVVVLNTVAVVVADVVDDDAGVL